MAATTRLHCRPIYRRCSTRTICGSLFMKSPTRRTSDVSNMFDMVLGRDGFSCISYHIISMGCGRPNIAPRMHASDHHIIAWTMSSGPKPASQLVNYKFRSTGQVSLLSIIHTPEDNVEELAVITESLDSHFPLQERKKYVSTRQDNRYLSKDAVDRRGKRRELEIRWRCTRDVIDYVAYRKSCRVANKIQEHRRFTQQLLQRQPPMSHADAGQKSETSFTSPPYRRSDLMMIALGCQTGFTASFVVKIRRLKVPTSSRLVTKFKDRLLLDVRVSHGTQMFADITPPPSIGEIYKLIRLMPAKSSPL